MIKTILSVIVEDDPDVDEDEITVEILTCWVVPSIDPNNSLRYSPGKFIEVISAKVSKFVESLIAEFSL